MFDGEALSSLVLVSLSLILNFSFQVFGFFFFYLLSERRRKKGRETNAVIPLRTLLYSRQGRDLSQTIGTEGDTRDPRTKRKKR